MRTKLRALAALFGVAVLLLPAAASAAPTTSLSQVIGSGTMTYDIVDGSGASVASPSVAFPSTTFDFACQTKSATLGTSTQKVRINNPRLGGVKLDIAGTGSWSDGSHTYSYNDGAGSGCTNGQMTVGVGSFDFNQTSGANTPTYTTPGGSFSGATPVTLFNNTSTTAWDADLTGYTLSQKIPAEQPDGTYSLSMTLTAIEQ